VALRTAIATRRLRSAICGAAAFAAASHGCGALADQGGVSYWVPGQYASFAAIAPPPGWSLPLAFYAYDGSIGVETQLQRGKFLSAGLQSSFEALFISPTYTPDTMILGARPSFSLGFAPGYNVTSGSVAIGPMSASRTDTMFGATDLFPTGQLFWNPGGVNNFMTYLTGDIPVGSYNPNLLAGIGNGHAAIDAGGAYTYLNTKTGTEFSATLGFTKNFENYWTHYTNGIDSHLDLAASQFLTKQFFVGVVGYYYQQLTADSGQLPILGPNESRTRAIGPQLGYNFNVGGQTISTNVRGYVEFDSYRRTQGRAIFAAIEIPLSGLFPLHSPPDSK
jgi:hypothetical protein